MQDSKDIKNFYQSYHDKINDKRFESPFPIRKYAHHAQYNSLITHIKDGETILDAGCGEGTIGLLLAERSINSTGIDISEKNVRAANDKAREKGLDQFVIFSIGDAENLPFPDASFDVVVSSHVLEHLPNFDKGWLELQRVARKRIVLALPTCMNPCAWALLGGDTGYWSFSKRSIFALPYGLIRVLVNVLSEGVQEGYGGKDDIPHIWRYPWVVKRRLLSNDWRLSSYEASSLCMPYFEFLLPIAKRIDRYKNKWPLKYFGFGSTLVFDKKI